MTFIPKMQSIPMGGSKAYGKNRWRWYYDSIADWMIANPGGQLKDCAKHINKHPNTVTSIIRSDLFQEYLAQRKQEWQREHDRAIVQKTTAVAERALDIMLDKMEKQADKIPMQVVAEVATNALDRLGYAPKAAAAVQVNVDNSTTSNQVVMVPISPEALEEARDAIRLAEQQRKLEARRTLELEAEPTVEDATDETRTAPESTLTLDDVE